MKWIGRFPGQTQIHLLLPLTCCAGSLQELLAGLARPQKPGIHARPARRNCLQDPRRFQRLEPENAQSREGKSSGFTTNPLRSGPSPGEAVSMNISQIVRRPGACPSEHRRADSGAPDIGGSGIDYPVAWIADIIDVKAINRYKMKPVSIADEQTGTLASGIANHLRTAQLLLHASRPERSLSAAFPGRSPHRP